ncbi:MAG: hypothetical protein JW939_02115 [Candidatus Thermoplasmatota archaeon]|nr:hypothetical protein [Candidatus Thermoplasmatota archaeon]
MKCANCDNKDCYTGKDCPGFAEEAGRRYTGEDLRSMKVSTYMKSRYGVIYSNYNLERRFGGGSD